VPDEVGELSLDSYKSWEKEEKENPLVVSY